MTDEPAEPAVTPHASGDAPDAADDSVRATFARLIEDGRAYASAEAEKQKLRAGIVAVGVRNAAILGVIALILVFAAIVALLIGLIFALAQVIAPIWATLIVVGGALVVVMLLLLLAKGCISRMMKAITP
ncbi:phage holin family protein [Sphingobium amiense]|uniref:Phage holin family protein n=1 Tax=Sphingobium amiense TaxID=135719 RepID=A0A494VZY6_9SPHN|nr:phage holin family protein [Sphingobium amiense]BBD97984.1 phage holin family protein [Sphingobium amiense]